LQLVHLWFPIVVSQLDPDLSSVTPFAVQRVPIIFLTASSLQQGVKIDPSLTNEIGLLVIVENGQFQVVVVGAVVYDES